MTTPDDTKVDRHAARRQRQLLEIARLVADGATERAAGLAFEHLALFPHDQDVLDPIINDHADAEGER